jgi:hypothetical protein
MRYRRMSKEKYVYLLYQKDFAEDGNDRYFLYEDGTFSEIGSFEVVSLDCFVVTHDFYLISSSLYKKHEKLPRNIVDVVMLSKIISGVKFIDSDTQPWEISKTIKPLYMDSNDFDAYLSMYYRREPINIDTYMLFSHKLAEYAEILIDEASKSGESERFFNLELPIYNNLVLSACKGIRVSNDKIRTYKELLKLNFYREIKRFAEKHGVMYQLPNDGEIKEKLMLLGYNVEDYSLEFLIDFLPSRDGYTDDLRSIQKTNKSYHIFNSISSSASRIRPIVESHWTSTARIYHKSPSIQNISKKYRDIFIADDGLALCYVDYDQFEVGVMAALSDDPIMKYIYENTDAYNDLAMCVFNDLNYRKKSKIMFLSYTYGMSLENLMNSVTQLGGNQKKAREYFSKFSVFESWKNTIYGKYRNEARISTIFANYLNRKRTGELSEKEQRSAINHVIQGSATYIFKMALLELGKQEGVQILIPMHDAAFFQHPEEFEARRAVDIFENTMTDLLGGKIKGKASLEHFFQP